ncbi:MAG TPA: S9 family peptidase [Pyrinomonadaceae bacterium]|nr:S9 family peptidase [Pyrinomonadaceae bacterium]
MRRELTTAALALLALLAAPAISAQTQQQPPQQQTAAERRDDSIERYLNIRSATGPTVSPAGERVAFLMNTTGTAQIWAVDARGGWPEQLTFYADRVDFVRFAPDGSGLVFGKSRGGDENAQFYWMAADGARVRPLTDAPKIRHNFGGFSPDGRRIAYSSNRRDPNFFDVYVMDVATAREELVYQQDGSNGVAAWSHDGRFLVVSRSNEQLSLDNDLFLVELATRAVTHLTPHTGAAQYSDVHFARDGRSIILATNAEGEWLRLSRLDLSTRKIAPLEDSDWDTDATALSRDGRLFAYTLNRDGFSELYVRPVNADGTLGARPAPVKLPGKGIVSGLEFSADASRLALTFSGARFNANVWLYDTRSRALSQVTRASLAGIPQTSFAEPELVRYKTFDGREIPAWYYRPQPAANRTASQGATGATGGLPVIVSVHGGPEAQERPGFNAVYQYFLSRGYAVFAPNVRGSTGYGKTYTHLDDVKLREDSVKDLAASVEWLKTQGGADSRRIAVMGGSYGGYMVLAAITLYPDLWSAAVEMFGIANFETNLRNTSGYRRRQREREYGTLANDLEFLKSVSPIYKVDRIRAPLFVLQGRNDPRVPYTESEQIVKALRDRNRPVEYILFEDEGHGFVKLANRLVLYPRVVEFLDRHMK